MGGENFDEYTHRSDQDVHQNQIESHDMVEKFVSGGRCSIARSNDSRRESKNKSRTLMEIRNKTVDMFKRIN